jgi:hypothetical protein
MSTDKLNIAVIEEFIKKVRLASKSGQKEIKFPISELENVIHNLSIVSLRILEKDQNRIIHQELSSW